MLNVPHTSGKILRYSGPSRPRGGPTFMVPPQRDRFEALKKLIRQEHVRELQRKYETEQKQELKEIAAGRGNEDYVYGTYGEQEPSGLQQLEYAGDEPAARHGKKPQVGSRQVSQFSRYSDVMLPPVRRTFYHPYFEYIPEYGPYY
ncbi:jg16986 [Pararge aegeria aegeria]|uniref:Jg16986 protein n=3 Tax=Pararge aegeria TaxID=116150 RepID=A0A8S4RGF7_9NEOP|nr:jg16986 [Pararge aegeria aegeria]